MDYFRVRLSTFCILCTFQSLNYKNGNFLLLHSKISFSTSGGKTIKHLFSLWLPLLYCIFHLFLYLVLSFNFLCKTKLFFLFSSLQFYSYLFSHHLFFLTTHFIYFFFYLRSWMVALLNSFPLTRVCQCFLSAKNSSLWTHCECFTCWTCHWFLIPQSVATEIYVESAADTGLKPHQGCQLAALPCK